MTDRELPSDGRPDKTTTRVSPSFGIGSAFVTAMSFSFLYLIHILMDSLFFLMITIDDELLDDDL